LGVDSDARDSVTLPTADNEANGLPHRIAPESFLIAEW
jgi:hypothetical protein